MRGGAVIAVQLELKISEIDFFLGFRLRVPTSHSFLCTMHSLQSKYTCELFSLWEVLCATEHLSRAHDHYTKSAKSKEFNLRYIERIGRAEV